MLSVPIRVIQSYLIPKIGLLRHQWLSSRMLQCYMSKRAYYMLNPNDESSKEINNPTHKKLYLGFTDCLIKTVSEEGVLTLWHGFIPIWARFAPTSTIQLLTIKTQYNFFSFKSI
jgi:ABC-type uncharacterized transport system fused permease/ATPase subunit